MGCARVFVVCSHLIIFHHVIFCWPGAFDLSHVHNNCQCIRPNHIYSYIASYWGGILYWCRLKAINCVYRIYWFRFIKHLLHPAHVRGEHTARALSNPFALSMQLMWPWLHAKKNHLKMLKNFRRTHNFDVFIFQFHFQSMNISTKPNDFIWSIDSMIA